ncbi:MAG: A/G-specific adenine glycosylase [Gammaproteobacteria bacterium]
MASNASPANPNPEPLATALLRWFDQHGRHDLPWQHPRDGYRVWVTEIMLQHTQVTTVIPYFTRFMQAFPDVQALADAALDDVLHHWTGLGYYARARNLHRAAQQVRDQHGAQFPREFNALIALPGIGRSTAGAILAQAFDQRYPILDGNVKRVLTRLHAIAGWPGEKAVENRLWTIAEAHTPSRRVADYTQAIMDLGATVCRRSKPACDTCPLQARCEACASATVAEFPGKKPRKALPVRSTCMLLLLDDERNVLLEQRPASGIWGGLWSFPECPPDSDPQQWSREHLQLELQALRSLPTLRHTFSHFHLDITPVLARAVSAGIMDSPRHIWYNSSRSAARGFPAPVKQLLDTLPQQLTEDLADEEMT